MASPPLSDLEYEILDSVCQEDESTTLILSDLRNPLHADHVSKEARGLDFAGLDAVFSALADRGLVTRKQEETDGRARPRRGVTHTWWSMTPEGRRVWEAWADAP